MSGMFKSRILFRFLFSYVIILLLPIIIGVFAYLEAVKIISMEEEQSNLSILKQGMNTIDGQLAATESVVDSIAMNSRIRKVSTFDSPLVDSANICDIIDAYNDIKIYMQNNRFFREIMIYFKNSDQFITGYSVYMRSRMFFDDTFKYSDLLFSQWYDCYINTPHVREYLPGSQINLRGVSYSVIPYIQSLPNNNLHSINAVITVFIDENEVKKSFSSLNLEKGGAIFIINSENQIITSLGSEKVLPSLTFSDLDMPESDGTIKKTIDGKPMIISYSKSAVNRWRYIAVIPSGYVLQKVTYIKDIIILIVMISLVLGVLLSTMMAYRNLKPIKAITGFLNNWVEDSGKDTKNEYDLLQYGVGNIIAKNKDLQEDLRRQKPILRSALFYRLLYGGFDSISEIEDALRRDDFEINGDSFMTVIMRINISPENDKNGLSTDINVIKAISKNEIPSLIGSNVYVGDIDLDKIVILIWFEKNKSDDYKSAIENMASTVYFTMLNKYGIRVSFFAGGLYNNLFEISRSFSDARHALNSKFYHSGSMIHYYQFSEKSRNCFYYPLDIEIKLINLLKSGEYDNAIALLKQCYYENSVNRNLSNLMIKNLMYELIATITKVCSQFSNDGCRELDSDLGRLDSCDTLDELFDAVCGISKTICDHVNDAKQKCNNKLMIKIVDYVDKNFQNAQLSLSSTAEKFDISEQYLSIIFKDKTGKNFSTYIEHKRIDQASYLLRSTDLPVEDIASMTGYNSSNAFRKAFKRINAVNPTCIRETGR